MKKRTLSMILALVMCLCLAVPALASSIRPRSPNCPDEYCGGETIYTYLFEKQYPCEQCGKDGCGPRYWIWLCTSCNEFVITALMDYACD